MPPPHIACRSVHLKKRSTAITPLARTTSLARFVIEQFAMCTGSSSARTATGRTAPCRLLALPESVLHLIMVRLPGRDAAHAAGACRAFAAAVRSQRHTSLVLEMDATLPKKLLSGPAGAAKRRLQRAAGVRGAHNAAITVTTSCLSDDRLHAAAQHSTMAQASPWAGAHHLQIYPVERSGTCRHDVQACAADGHVLTQAGRSVARVWRQHWRICPDPAARDLRPFTCASAAACTCRTSCHSSCWPFFQV